MDKPEPPTWEHERYLSVKEVAARYDVGTSSIWTWAANGTFPQPLKLSFRCTRWKLSDLLEWEANLERWKGS